MKVSPVPVRQFEVRGGEGADVTDVGLRAQVYSSALKFQVKAAPVNVARDRVRIVASGEEGALVSLRDDTLRFCTEEPGLPAARVSELGDYEGLEPDWSSYASMFSAEQTSKGVGYLRMTYEKFGEVDKKFGAISDKLSPIMAEMAEQTKKTNDLLESFKAESKESRDRLDESLRLLREAVDKMPSAGPQASGSA